MKREIGREWAIKMWREVEKDDTTFKMDKMLFGFDTIYKIRQ